MGLLDDISMGLGLKERDKDYYDRTAQTMERTQGRDRAQQYRQSKGFGQTGRQGLLSFMGNGSDKSSGGQSQRKSTGLIPTLFGYRDYTDMFDRGGKFASGGRYQGAGGYSMLANLAHALSGQEFGERTPYKMKADVSVKQGGNNVNTRPLVSGPAPSYANMDMGEAGRGRNMGLTDQMKPPVLDVPLQSGNNQIGQSTQNTGNFPTSNADAAVVRGASGAVPNTYPSTMTPTAQKPQIAQDTRLAQFNMLTSTIPQQLMGTEAGQFYVEEVLNGRTNLPFQEFFAQNFR